MRLFILLTILISACSWKTMDFREPDKRGKVEYGTVFAWFPTECPDGKSYWLETIPVRKTWDVPDIFSGQVEHDHCVKEKI